MSTDFITKKISFLLDHINELSGIVLLKRPADLHIREYYRANKYLGSKDRYITSEVVYFILRHYNYLKNLNLELTHSAFYLAYCESETFRKKISKLIKGFNAEEYFGFDSNLYDKYRQTSPKEFFPKEFVELLPSKDNQYFNSLNEEATTDIRVIREKGFIQNELNEQSIPYYSNIYPGCLKLKERAQLKQFTSYKRGYFEVQEEGSQLVSALLPLDISNNILDACSGAGGKALHIADLKEDTGSIYCSDIDHNRLNELKRRRDKHNLESLKLINNEEVKSSFDDFFDLVLVDAPCTGSGTIRRSPESRYHINKAYVAEMQNLQIQLLDEYSKKVRPGGFLAYATCSLFEEENDGVIESFLNSNSDFSIHMLNLELINDTDRGKILDGYYLRTSPLHSDMDGFFLALLKKD